MRMMHLRHGPKNKRGALVGQWAELEVRMRRWPRLDLLFRVLIFVLVVAATLSHAAAATPQEIQAAIDKGKAFLYGIQSNDNWEVVQKPDPLQIGGWQVENAQFTGMTAIATYALLASGEDPQNPKLKRAIEWLKKHETHGVYALGLRCQVWNSIPLDNSVKAVILHDRQLLLDGLLTKDPAIGFYGYEVKDPTGDFDHSASQFGVLGMWALEQTGVEVPTKYWQIVDAAWRRQQLADASWSYKFPDTTGGGTLSMTAAGVATLFVAKDYTSIAAKCSGNINDPSIDRGMEFIGANLRSLGPIHRYYSLFGVSRVGLASGFKYIGGVDWFQFGTGMALADQQPDGSWNGGDQNPKGVPNTSFALLFLSRGRAPIMMNKLAWENVTGKQIPVGSKSRTPVEITAPGDWNQRPRDVANVTRMIGRQIESQLNWQIVSLKQKREDLHDAPILFMSGSTAPKLSAADQRTLKTYIEDGGLVLGHADCESGNFAEGFRKLGEAMFPGRKFANLPNDSPIYIAENFPRRLWKTKPALEGLSNGTRDLMLLIPRGDPGKVWQTDSFPFIKSDVFGQLMINILLYSDDQEGLRQRDQTYLLTRNDAVHATKTLKIARIQYAGNWDPEPGGWRRLAIAMHNDRHIDLDVHAVDPATGGLNQSYNAAVLTLAGGLSLSDAACKAIHDYVTGGGTLVMDVAGGGEADRSAADAELGKIFPDAKRPFPHLPADSPVYDAGHQITNVTYRHYARMVLGNVHTPELSGLTLGNRVAVIYSADDISSGLVGQSIGGIVGYAPESATRLMENILTYAGSH
jgi:hypothetical protein